MGNFEELVTRLQGRAHAMGAAWGSEEDQYRIWRYGRVRCAAVRCLVRVAVVCKALSSKCLGSGSVPVITAV